MSVVKKQGVFNELVLPFKYKDELITNFTARELSLAQVKQLGKTQSKANYPFQWIARACCWSIEEMGGVKVYEEYRDTGKVPDIIKLLPMVSTNSVLIAGHIATMGEQIEDVPGVCPTCGNKENHEINLLSVDIPFLEGETYEDKICESLLTVGYTPSAKAKKDLQLADAYTRLQFRLPVLGDLLKLEDSFRDSKDITDFFENLMGECIISLESESGDQLPDNILKMRKRRVLETLKPRDWKKARTDYNKNVPELEISTDKPCSDCGTKITYNVDQNFLFL